MSMSKYNLYNLARARNPAAQYRTQNFFKQKWQAKSELRAYHGEHIRERQWQKMFSTKLNSVVPMNPAYLAQNDGSRESAGRGSGLDRADREDTKRTPYMLQTFAPLERRLDIAIFRSLFASSARQARQFVVHGAVTVNGKPVSDLGAILEPY
jgi:ribosomal protein S4